MSDDSLVAEGAVRGAGELLTAARARIQRLEPRAAWEAAQEDALIVDIRSQDDRRRDGVVPGALHVPRTVLEWRVDPTCKWHNPYLGGRGRRLVLLCDHGFSSSLAAASLVDLGCLQAGDVIGGFVGWREDGLPVRPAGEPGEGVLPGMGPPD
jgi:rhodanese-related sulfurtransferase